MKSGQGLVTVALPYGSSLLSVGERVTPLAADTVPGYESPAIYSVLWPPIFGSFSAFVAQDGST